eukprot:12881714-Prorocentrum_lima.AAC.1
MTSTCSSVSDSSMWSLSLFSFWEAQQFPASCNKIGPWTGCGLLHLAQLPVKCRAASLEPNGVQHKQ